MNDRETRGILWILNKIKTGVITINIPKEKGKGKASVQVFESEAKIIPILKQGELNFEVKVRVDTDLYENSSKMDLSP